MKTDELVAGGFLTEDIWVVPLRTTDGEVLTPRQALRVYGHTKRASLPDGLGELCDPSMEARPVHVVPDDAYAFTAAMDAQWREHDVFPYDTAQVPEKYDSLRMPAVVKRAMDRVLLPFNTKEDLLNLVRRYRGDFDDCTKDAQAMWALHKQHVIRRVCGEDTCNELVAMSLRAAVVYIEKYGLLPEETLKEFGLKTDGYAYRPSKRFRPHSLCTKCADRQQEGRQRAQGCDAPAKEQPRSHTSSRWRPKLGDATPT